MEAMYDKQEVEKVAEFMKEKQSKVLSADEILSVTIPYYIGTPQSDANLRKEIVNAMEIYAAQVVAVRLSELKNRIEVLDKLTKS